MFPPFSCSASTAKVLLLAGLNRFRFLAAGHASGANFSGLKHQSRKTIYTAAPNTLNHKYMTIKSILQTLYYVIMDTYAIFEF